MTHNDLIVCHSCISAFKPKAKRKYSCDEIIIALRQAVFPLEGQ